MTAQDLKYSSSTIQADLDRFQRQKVADLREMTINMARSHRDWCKKVGSYCFEIQPQSCWHRTLRRGKLRRKKWRRFLTTPIPCPRRNTRKLQVLQTFGEIPPPQSTADENVVTSQVRRNTHGLVVTFFFQRLNFLSTSFLYLNLLLDIPRLDRVPHIFLMRNSTGTSCIMHA